MLTVYFEKSNWEKSVAWRIIKTLRKIIKNNNREE
jgi:hypothetical protein